MQAISSKFNLYDHLAYVLVGFYQLFNLLLLCLMYGDIELEQFFVFLDLRYSLFILIFAYFVGHIVQAISNVFVKQESESNDFSLIEESIIKKARKLLKLPENISKNLVFQYCYMYVILNDKAGIVATFNSIYGFYRGVFLASILSFTAATLIWLYMGAINVIQDNLSLMSWYIVVIGLITLLFKKRKERFSIYIKQKTLVIFDILLKKFS